ncbi:hypothetical protein [Paraburkholderia sp. Ac-20340]|uniref:hypothetical protein n=1 Tax=Paraburkholderia sp. Ac-20340 TaxID=2703888 RepID=UPI00197F3190|nr:hypothetical protein [Paraburkholderia sp. Ac-20340]
MNESGAAEQDLGTETSPDLLGQVPDMDSAQATGESPSGEIASAPAEAALSDISATTSAAGVALDAILGAGKAPDTPLAADGDDYAPPSWGEFRTFVLNNGHKFVRASYPNPPTDLIETIWCGVPVVHHEIARVMTPKSVWLEYGDAESR